MKFYYFLLLLIITFITGFESVSVVTVKHNDYAVLPCSGRCEGSVKWTATKEINDDPAVCDSSCRVKGGYQMNYDQHLKGDFSLTINKADVSKTDAYTCKCNDTTLCDVVLYVKGSVPSVTVKFHDSAVLPCLGNCTGIVNWRAISEHNGPKAECKQGSCTSVVEGYEIKEEQYKKGDYSLTISKADFNNRDLYVCYCDDTKLQKVQLLVEAPQRSTPQINPGKSLMMKVDVSDPVEVIYSRTVEAGASSDQICTVNKTSLQCKSEYNDRSSLTSSDLELRHMKESESGVYIIRNIRYKEDIHIFTVQISSKQDQDKAPLPWWVIAVIVMLVVLVLVLVLVLALAAFVIWQNKKKLKVIWRNVSGETISEISVFKDKKKSSLGPLDFHQI